ncbi:MAG: amino acid ABC transporter ATP-binding protein, partial [Okeania sp. SIO2H7]|nr:amino acid ABC transporter ATP-binding protein [Okeania sp. SIO2H7]
MTETKTKQTETQIDSDLAIVARDVQKWYSNNFHVLRGVSLTVKRGEVVVIMG